MNAKIYVLNYKPCCQPFSTVNFTNNSADYGGAIYVSNNSCKSDYNFQHKGKECFLHTLEVYCSMPSNKSQESTSNHASHLLLTKPCKSIRIQFVWRTTSSVQNSVFHKFSSANIHYNNSSNHQYDQLDMLVSRISYMTNISNIDMSDIGSQPVKLYMLL